ncbi:MAG TPA: ATP-binding protein [Chitinophagaceae bacterium]|nr:ATP-binding protein [Chitinophagaceae bacterium]
MNQANTEINTLVIIGIATMLFLVVSLLLLFTINQRKKLKFQLDMQQLREKQQNQLIEAAVRSEEGERHRIAELLHDEVGALLSSSRIFLVEMNTNNFSQTDKDDHSKVKSIIDESIQKVRGISHNLHSTVLKEFGLNEAIRNFMYKVAEGPGLKSSIELDEDYQMSNKETDLAAYRILQELTNNLLKHAHPNLIEITSKLKESELKFCIIHNGNGLTQEQFEELRYKPEGLGLKNIQNRIILLKGNIYFTRQDTDKYAIELIIPVIHG